MRWPSLKERQLAVAAAGILVSLALIYSDRWPFHRLHNHPNGRAPTSFTGAILNDRITLGYLRLGIVAFAAFVFVSVPALVVAGRWAKGIGTSGITVDEAEEAKESLKELQAEIDTIRGQLDRVTDQRDSFQRIAQRLLSGQRKLFDDQSILNDPPGEGNPE